MKEIHINILAVCLISVVLLSACSVTKHLPEGGGALHRKQDCHIE